MKKQGRQLNPNFVKAHKRPSAEVEGGVHVSVPSGVPSALFRQARRSGQFNLSNRSLTAVPEGVWRINIDAPPDQTVDIGRSDSSEQWWDQVDLTKLILASNQLKELSEDIKYLVALTVLDVHGNVLESLPHNIGHLEHLTRLTLSHNCLKALVPEVWSLSSLKSLKLDHNQLTVVPEEIGNLKRLEELDLSHNKLVSVPGSLGELSELLHLDLSHNELKVLPEGVGRLQALRDFSVSHNRLDSLPPFLSAVHLAVLDVRQNMLTSVPVVHSANSLKELLLGENKIAELDMAVLAGYTVLVLFELRGNALTQLPEGITAMETLERLDLSNNHLTSLPPKLGRMHNLKSLSLDGNPLKAIRLAVVQKGTFEILKYLRSRIVDEPEELPPSVSTKKVASTSLGTAPRELGKSPPQDSGKVGDKGSPRKAVLPEVTMATEQQWPPDTRVVDLSKKELTEVPESMCQLVQLREVNLAFNRLTSLPAGMASLVHLTELDVRNNRLVSLPDGLSGCAQLRTVIIEHNQFTELPPVLYQLKAIESILAANNQISSLDVDGLKDLPLLSCLDLSNNNIHQVPPQLGLVTSLKTLLLTGNPFRNPRPAILAKGTHDLLAYLRDRIPQ